MTDAATPSNALPVAPSLPNGSMLVLETPRLWLRTWHWDDLPVFQRIVEDPEVMRYVLEGQTWLLERTRTWLHDQIGDYAKLGFSHYALLPKAAQDQPQQHDAAGHIAPIGFCGIRPGGREGESTETFHTGWRLSREWWGQGLASEGAQGVLRHAFEALRLPHLIATAHQDNVASVRIMQKLGMRELHRYTTDAGRAEVIYRIDNPLAGQTPPA